MKILVIGALGQLGREVVKQANGLGLDVSGVDIPEIDITDIRKTDQVISDSQPTVLVNAAAYTAVDKAETEEKLAFAVNKAGPANLSKLCTKNNIPMIHISTDFVFDGQTDSPYVETDSVHPLGVYGRSKAEGETAVRSELVRHIIIRTSWLHGTDGPNFVKTMLRLGKERDVIQVVSDQYGSPTSAVDLAEAVLMVAQKIQSSPSVPWGTYHYCGHGITNWYEFAKKIFELARIYNITVPIPTVSPISTAEFPTAAKRPGFSGLNCDLIREKFDIHTKPWEESLEKVIARLAHGDNIPIT